MGPLHGTRLIEIEGIGPGPFCGMLLSDMGAEVLRIERPGPRGPGSPPTEVMGRGRRHLCVDLKNDAGRDLVLSLCAEADGIFEGFRPGVMERLGLGPDACMAANPRLVYGRMTGWGQDGPLAQAAGHDINYIALAGALHGIGRPGERPVPPLNLVGDFGGGGMLLAFGIVCALLEAARSGRGQVVDAAMVDGAALLMAMFFGSRTSPLFAGERGANLLDGGAPFYDTYETRDGKYVAIGAIEPQFYAELIARAGLEGEALPAQMDQSAWPGLKHRFADVFRTRTRDEWCSIMEGTDVCFAPVLSLEEVAAHPHNAARNTFLRTGGVLQPGAAPRFSRSHAAPRARDEGHDLDARRILGDYGIESARIDRLVADGVVRG